MAERKKDTQIVEIKGRNKLVNALLEKGIEVAIPLRDNGIDLIIFDTSGQPFKAIPIQMKAAEKRSFSFNEKYKKIPDIRIAYVWNVDKKDTEIYLLKYQETRQIVEKKGYKLSKTKKGVKHYTVSSIAEGNELYELIRPYCLEQMSSTKIFETDRK